VALTRCKKRPSSGVIGKSAAAIIGYFLFAFLIYAISDFIAWRLLFRDIRDKYLDDRMAAIKEKNTGVIKETSPRILLFLLKSVRPMSWFRILFLELGIPILAGITAIALLICESVK
jgi:hypothetical protein